MAGWHGFGVRKEAGRFVFLVSSSDAISAVRLLLSDDFRCHGEDWSMSPLPGNPGRGFRVRGLFPLPLNVNISSNSW